MPSEAVAPPQPPVAEKPKEEVKPDLVMPSLEKGPQSFIDEKTGAFWVGLPLTKIDYLTASALLDCCKIDVLAFQQQLAVKAKIVKPAGNGLKEFVNKIWR